MKELIEEILSLYDTKKFQLAEEKAQHYFSLCKNEFMEELTVDSATNFAGSALLLSQICASEKKPWKAIPALLDVRGCIRFLEDYMQDREILASTCNSLAAAFEYAGFLPEAREYYQKAVCYGKDPSFLESAVYSFFLLLLRTNGSLTKEDRELAGRVLPENTWTGLMEQAKTSFSGLLHTDSVEKKPEFLNVRYDVEKKVDEILTAEEDDGTPYAIRYWNCKKNVLLADYGIEWKTPAECNPDINFC